MGGNIVVSGDNEIEEAGLPIFDVVSIIINVLSVSLIHFTFNRVMFLVKNLQL